MTDSSATKQGATDTGSTAGKTGHLCAGGYPLPEVGACPTCGALENEFCKRMPDPAAPSEQRDES